MLSKIKKCIKGAIIIIWKILRKLHIISDYTFRGLMLHFTDEYKFLTISEYFDKKWYVNEYPDVAINPTQHYMKFGFKEGKNPSPLFDGKAYLEALTDIRELRVNPLLDLEMCGLRERRPCPSVTNFWGFHECAGRKYIVLSSVLKEITVKYNEDVMENVELDDSASDFFRRYILKEFSENTYMYDVTDKPFKYGNEIKVETELNIPMYILTLFVWSSFSYKLVLSDKKYFAVNKNRIIVTDKNAFMAHYTSLCNPQQRQCLEYMSKLTDKDKDITLFSEFRNIANDNTWQVFTEALKHDENCYFVTGQMRYDSETDAEIKKHLIVYNSEEHLNAFMHAKKIFCSWTLSDVVPTIFKHEFFAYPFITDNWYYCPHGISYDKNSYFLTPIFLSQPKKVYCCSENEKNYFENKCGLKNIHVLGYPRMDKWGKATDNDILFDFTYRKQYEEEYFEVIAKVVKAVREKYADRNIYYLFHPAISYKNQDKIMEMIGDESISYAHASDQKSFNEWFNNCKYLITDYSSVAYDFAYKEDSVSIYYLEEGFTENHYELYDEFYEKNCGVIVKSPEELIEVLGEDMDLTDVNNRTENFFKYIDHNNTSRVYEDAFVE